MKILYGILLLFIFSGCSIQERANWHLKRALELDRQILNEQRDTIYDFEIEWKDTIISVIKNYQLNINSDTVTVTDTIYSADKPLPSTRMTAVSKDGIAFAEFWIEDNKRHLRAYAKLDTIVKLHLKIKTQQKVIREKEKILISQEATITELRTWKEKVQDFLTTTAWIIGGIVIIVLILKVIKLI